MYTTDGLLQLWRSGNSKLACTARCRCCCCSSRCRRSQGKLTPSLCSAMLCAARKGHLQLVRFLYSDGASFICTSGEHTTTALHMASEAGHEGIVKFILARGFAVHSGTVNFSYHCILQHTVVIQQQFSYYLMQVRTSMQSTWAMLRLLHKPRSITSQRL